MRWCCNKTHRNKIYEWFLFGQSSTTTNTTTSVREQVHHHIKLRTGRFYLIPKYTQLWQWDSDKSRRLSVELPESSREQTGHKQARKAWQIPEHVHHKVQNHLMQENRKRCQREDAVRTVVKLGSIPGHWSGHGLCPGDCLLHSEQT